MSAALLSAPAAAAAPPPSPWLQTGYDSAHSNANTAETTLTRSALHSLHADLAVTAQHAGDDQCSEPAPEVPALSQDRLYTVVDGVLEARELTSGQVLWRTVVDPFDDLNYVGVAVSHGLVVVASEDCPTNDPVTVLGAYDTSTGHLAWQKGFGEAIEGFSVYGKYLVAQTGCFYCDQTTWAYRVQTGTLVWRRAGRFPDSPGADFQPGIVVGRRVFVSSQAPDGSFRLRARHVSTGRPAWLRRGPWQVVAGDTGTPEARTLVVRNAATGVVAVLDPATGRTRYRLPGLDAASASPFGESLDIAVGRDRIFGFCGATGQRTCAFRISDGHRRWTRPEPSRGVPGLFLAGGLVYLGDGHVLSSRTGARVATVPGRPALAGSGRLVSYSGATLTVWSG